MDLRKEVRSLKRMTVGIPSPPRLSGVKQHADDSTSSIGISSPVISAFTPSKRTRTPDPFLASPIPQTPPVAPVRSASVLTASVLGYTGPRDFGEVSPNKPIVDVDELLASRFLQHSKYCHDCGEKIVGSVYTLPSKYCRLPRKYCCRDCLPPNPDKWVRMKSRWDMDPKSPLSPEDNGVQSDGVLHVRKCLSQLA